MTRFKKYFRPLVGSLSLSVLVLCVMLWIEWLHVEPKLPCTQTWPEDRSWSETCPGCYKDAMLMPRLEFTYVSIRCVIWHVVWYISVWHIHTYMHTHTHTHTHIQTCIHSLHYIHTNVYMYPLYLLVSAYRVSTHHRISALQCIP